MENAMNLAFVLLSKPGLPDAHDVVSSFGDFATERQRLALRSSEPGAGDGEVLQLDAGEYGCAFVADMHAPVPDREAEGGVQFSMSAMGTGWELPPHVAHLIVTVSGPEPSSKTPSSKTEAVSFFTSLLAAVVAASPAVGVYWGNARATHDPKFFLSVAREPDIGTRILLWTGVSVAREADGGLSLLSLGMEQLGLPDLLFAAPGSMPGNDALGTFFDLLSYVAKRGSPLPAGDTVGRTAKEKLPVQYVASPVHPDKQVWRIEIR
jgi:hypothetical protein